MDKNPVYEALKQSERSPEQTGVPQSWLPLAAAWPWTSPFASTDLQSTLATRRSTEGRVTQVILPQVVPCAAQEAEGET